jgi:hypothetical protein
VFFIFVASLNKRKARSLQDELDSLEQAEKIDGGD